MDKLDARETTLEKIESFYGRDIEMVWHNETDREEELKQCAFYTRAGMIAALEWGRRRCREAEEPAFLAEIVRLKGE